MQRQVAPDYFALSPLSSDAAASSIYSTIQLGPPQRVRLFSSLSFFRKGASLVVTEPLRPLWFIKNWRRAADGKSYTGTYTAVGRTWRGMIQEPYPHGYTAYIWQPPIAEIRRNTAHGPCFMPNGESGRYQVYFHNTPTSLDHAITSIESVLAQAYGSRG